MSHCFSGDDDAADDDKLGQSIDLTSPEVPQVKMGQAAEHIGKSIFAFQCRVISTCD